MKPSLQQWGFFVIFICMRKLLLLVVCVFFTYTTFAQSESEQKVQKRVERDNPPSRVTTPSNPPVVVNPTPNYYNPYYGPNYYSPYYYGNNSYRYGGRNNGYNRRYYRQTPPPPPVVSRPVRSKKKNSDELIAFGLISSLSGEYPSPFGIRMSVGSQQLYFFGNYQLTRSNRVSHYDNITLADVIAWEDTYERTNKSVTKWDVGIGLMATHPIHPTLSFGLITITDYLVYYDELKLLSNNGLYSINGGKQTSGTMTIGVDVHLEDGVILNTGLGLVGPPNLTVGLQMNLND